MSSRNFRIGFAVRTVNKEQFLWLKGSEYKEVEGGRNSQIPGSNVKAILLHLLAKYYCKV
jgi:hypothetical protein